MNESDFDWSSVLESTGGDEELLAVVVDAARQEIPQLMDRVRRAAAEGDAAALRLSAHTLKGSIRYFGQTPALERAMELEQLAETGTTDGAGPMLAGLEEGIAALMAALAEYGAAGGR